MQLPFNWDLPDDELEWRAVRSSGPGGQHVNKTASKVELRFRMASSGVLTDGQKQRFVLRFPGCVTTAGVVVLHSDEHRSQRRNQEAVLHRLASMLEQIRRPPKTRRPTRVSAAAKARRVSAKRRRSDVKRMRQRPSND